MKNSSLSGGSVYSGAAPSGRAKSTKTDTAYNFRTLGHLFLPMCKICHVFVRKHGLYLLDSMPLKVLL